MTQCNAVISSMEGSLLQEMIQLKELLFVNLDLVQQQQEMLVEKDRKLHCLQQENESLKSRLERMSRRMSLCQLKQSVVSSPASVGDNVPVKAYRRVGHRDSTSDVSNRPGSEAGATTLGHVAQVKQNDENTQESEPARKIRVLSARRGRGAARRVDAFVREEQTPKARSASPGNRDSSSALKSKVLPSRKGKTNDNILTTDTLYYAQRQCDNIALLETSEPDITDGSNVLVPRWRINVVHSLYVMEGTENLNDSMFLKRHQKSETDEKRRKRWDVQRLRDLHLLQKQQHKIDFLSELPTPPETIASLMPDPDRLSYISVDDCVPVSAFGQSLPNLQASEFSLPWSELDTDHGKTTKVKKPGRKSASYYH